VVGAQAMVAPPIRFAVQGGGEQDRRPAGIRTTLRSGPGVPWMLPDAVQSSISSFYTAHLCNVCFCGLRGFGWH
jgi:hypothetical protein